MTLTEFENALQEIRAANGWRITLECTGLWILSIYDKETNEFVASTGMTGIGTILEVLKIPLTEVPWI